MIIREAEHQDYHEICTICNRDLGYECNSELVAQRLRNLDNKREIVFVAEMNKNIVDLYMLKYIMFFLLNP